jgi:hypothetical protein
MVVLNRRTRPSSPYDYVNVRYRTKLGNEGRAMVAIITHSKPHTFTVTGGNLNAKLYKSVKNATYHNEHKSISIGSYTFYFWRWSDYNRFAKKMKTMQ